MWNRTSGCQYLNTSAGTWFLGSTSEGAYSIGDTFTGHNFRGGTTGAWGKITATGCLGTCTPNEATYQWQQGTGTISINKNDSTPGCGRTTIGAVKMVNQCANGAPQQYWIRPNATPASNAHVRPNA